MLKYTAPAKDWSEALPIGNGRLGAMVYGRTDTELIQLNEDSVWYGGPQERTPRDALQHLSRLRSLIRSGDHVEAERLVQLAFFSTPSSARHYEPLGTAKIEFGHEFSKVTNYSRTLDLETAVLKVNYEYEGIQYVRETIASNPDQVLAMRISASEESNFVIRLNRVSEVEWETNEFLDNLVAVDGRLIMYATPGGKNSSRLCCVVDVQCEDGGSVETIGNALVVTTKKALIVISAQTTYRHEDVERVAVAQAVEALGLSDLFPRHIKDYQSLYNRMSLRLYPDTNEAPTNERILNVADPGLAALYHNYSRYLLISCSRPGLKALPATLQGIWSSSFQPAWGSKYTININLQMNYWPSNPCNISETETPLFDLLKQMASPQNGGKTAQTMYGAKGWCCHHNTDIWADTAPQDRWMPATLWPLGGAWLCTHIWENYCFNNDESLLKEMFPIMKGCVEFLIDFLIPDVSGKYLVTNPSVSPENSFISPSGVPGTLCEGSTIDIAIVSTVFRDFISINTVLHLDDELVPKIKETLERLPPLEISPLGTIREWSQHDDPEVEPGHRHLSHLWSLHPGHTITPTSTPELAAACAASLKRRAAHGGGHTGWSRAALVNLWARLGNGEECWLDVKKLLKDSTMPNLLDVHPPFQIDGNFGGGVGILEMLLQSEWELGGEATIRVLPACPAEWKRGKLTGAKCRGGFEVDFEWDNGVVEGPVVVRSNSGRKGKVVFEYSGIEVQFEGQGEHQIEQSK